jgi:hypothetical protein
MMEVDTVLQVSSTVDLEMESTLCCLRTRLKTYRISTRPASSIILVAD